MALFTPLKSAKQTQNVLTTKIIVIGDQGVGKTSLISRYLGKRCQNAYLPTLGVDIALHSVNFDNQELKIQIYDLGGAPYFHKYRPRYYRGSTAVILVYDRTKPSSLHNLQTWVKELERDHSLETLCIHVIGTKSDLEVQITPEEGENFVEEQIGEGIPHCTTNARTITDIRFVFDTIIKQIWGKVKEELSNRDLESYGGFWNKMKGALNSRDLETLVG